MKQDAFLDVNLKELNSLSCNLHTFLNYCIINIIIFNQEIIKDLDKRMNTFTFLMFKRKNK